MPVGALRAEIAYLQRSIGNRAVGQAIDVQRQGGDPPNYGTFTPPPRGGGAKVSHQSGVPLEQAGFGSEEEAEDLAFSDVEKVALTGMETKDRFAKVAQYEYDLPGPETEPLVPLSGAMKKWKVRGLATGAARYVGGKVIDTASGLPLSGSADALRTGLTDFNASDIPRPGYERIGGDPAVESASAVISSHLKRQGASKSAGVLGGAGGAVAGASLGSLLPVVGTVVGGLIGGFAGNKAASTSADAIGGLDRSSVKSAVLTLHHAALMGDADALALLSQIGLDDATIQARDGWKAALEALGL